MGWAVDGKDIILQTEAMAARVKALVEPAMLVWARKTASLTQEEVALALDVPLDRLQAWENESNDETPTVNQLKRLAERYKRPLSVFYLPTPPKDFLPLRDFRRLAGAVDHRFSAQLAYEVRAAYERRQIAIEVTQTLGHDPNPFGITARQTDDPEQVGRRIRERLGVSLEQQGRWRDPNNTFRGWREAIEQAGVLVFVLSGAHHQVELEEMRGFAIAEQPLPAIVINGRDRSPGRTFTLMHELAHVVLGQSAIENEVEPGDAIPAPERRIETFCNSVAAAVLMPAVGLLDHPVVAAKYRANAAWSDEEIAAVARRFGVSRLALLVRLVTLGRVTQAYVQAKRREYERQREEEGSDEKETGGFVPYQYQVLGHLGRGFTRLVLQGYNDNRLTLSTTSGYLGVQAKWVPTIERAVFGAPA
jgi:Zn-dependent peptidase ImmA (M78 family)/transcriptional regulator with XRE-family HTH domain